MAQQTSTLNRVQQAGRVVTLLVALALGVLGCLLPVVTTGALARLRTPLAAGAPAVTVSVLLAAGTAVAIVLVVARGLSWWWVAAIGLLVLVLRGSPMTIAVAVLLASLDTDRIARLAPVLAVAAVVTAASRLLDAGGNPDTWVGAVVVAALYVLLPGAVGAWLHARHQVFRGLRQRAEAAERERELAALQARTEERARIAEEVHDVVAHQLSLMVLYAGALHARLRDPELLEQAETIRTAGRRALDELREVLVVLHRDDDGGSVLPDGPTEVRAQPTLADLDRLVESVAGAGLTVRVERSGRLDDLPAPRQHAAYRVVREALTNVLKHAGAVPVLIEVRAGAETLVRVTNEPPSVRPQTLPGSGSGLDGLRRRVQVLGGTLSAGSVGGGGFEVVARWDGAVPPPSGSTRGAAS